MVPNPLILRAYLARGARLWVVARLAISGVLFLSGENPLRLSVPAVIEIVALAVAVGFMDVRRRRERALLENLAIDPLAVTTLFAAPAFLGELLVRTIAISIS